MTRTIRSVEFSYERAIERIICLDGLSWGWPTRASDAAIGNEDRENLDASVKRMRLSTMIDMDCRLSVNEPRRPSHFAYLLIRISLTLLLFRWDVLEPLSAISTAFASCP